MSISSFTFLDLLFTAIFSHPCAGAQVAVWGPTRVQRVWLAHWPRAQARWRDVQEPKRPKRVVLAVLQLPQSVAARAWLALARRRVLWGRFEH
jgi:hypothetical protein